MSLRSAAVTGRGKPRFRAVQLLRRDWSAGDIIGRPFEIEGKRQEICHKDRKVYGLTDLRRGGHCWRGAGRCGHRWVAGSGLLRGILTDIQCEPDMDGTTQRDLTDFKDSSR